MVLEHSSISMKNKGPQPKSHTLSKKTQMYHNLQYKKFKII